MNQEQPAKTAAAAPVAKKQASQFVTEGYRDGLDRLTQAFAEYQPLAVLVGEDDAGSNFIISSFLDGVGDDVAVAHVTEPCPDAIACVRRIVQAFGFDSESMGSADLEEVFSMFLSLQKMNDRRTIVCIEETQGNEGLMVDEIRKLVELETDRQFGLMVVLSGRSSLHELLDDRSPSTLPADAGPLIVFSPFTLAETTDYVRWRTESGGPAYVGPSVERDAITLIHDLTEGVPDAVSRLCSKCLELAEKSDTGSVTASIVIRSHQRLGVTHTVSTAPRPGMAGAHGRLIVRMNSQVVQEQKLDLGQVLIGRDRLSDIHLADAAVSRRHAKVVISLDSVTLTDLGSRNGTYVNGRQIEQCDLRDNDSIRIGQCRLDYVASDNGLG